MPAEPRKSSRDAIWEAATELFPRTGFAGTSVRDIAGAAQVDPALVIRHFGSKENLFLETMTMQIDNQPLLEWPIETLGEQFIRLILATEDQVRGTYLALLRASDTGDINSRLREVHELSFVAPLRERLAGPDAELRARLAAALVGGLLYALWVVGDDHLAAADPESIARHYGALLQDLLTPPSSD